MYDQLGSTIIDFMIYYPIALVKDITLIPKLLPYTFQLWFMGSVKVFKTIVLTTVAHGVTSLNIFDKTALAVAIDFQMQSNN